MTTYLVTGGAGFIGSHIAEALVARGDRVRILDNFSTGSNHNIESFASDLEVIEGDIRDEDTVADAVANVDCVFHQAALASVPRSIDYPLDTNSACVTGTVNVLDQSRRAGVRRLVYAASSSCYGDQAYTAKRESDYPSPLSPYAAAKLAGEMYCKAFGNSYDLETVCIRYFNVFGPRQDPNSPYSAVIPLFISAMLKNESPIVYGDGQQSRDFTFVKNVVHGNLLAASVDAAAGQTFNVATGNSFSLLTLLKALNEYLGTNITPTHLPPRVGDVRNSLADISEAERILGYEPQVGFHDGLQESIAYYRSICES